ncbi:MAG: VWA domain-containing protein [Gemmataceae bacterium]|nr:VWA domain-containing protein [Gemmataceae bacterium]
MTLRSSSGRLLLVVGLFVFAFAWVLAMGLVAQVSAGSRAKAASAPRDDGSVKAEVSNLERDNFNITLALKITDKAGNVVNGLTEQHIDVYEDGELVTEYKKFVPAGQGPVRVCLCLDYSRSMNGKKIVETRNAARAFLRLLRDQTDYAGVYVFNDYQQQHKTEEKLPIGPLDLLRREQAWDGIMFTPLADGSPMLETMERGLYGLERVTGRRVMVVLTDGMDTDEKEAVLKNKRRVSELAWNLGIPLYMVNMSTDEADEQMMRELAEHTRGQYHKVPSPEKLKEIVVSIGQSLQNEYTINYDSPNPVEDGVTRKVSAVVRQGGVGTQAQTEYKVAGVISTGVGAKKSDSGVGVRGSASPAMVFFPLAGLLGAMFAAPVLIRRRKSRDAEDASPAVAPRPAATTPRPQNGSSRS